MLPLLQSLLIILCLVYQVWLQVLIIHRVVEDTSLVAVASPVEAEEAAAAQAGNKILIHSYY
jgi:hypothetical protein